MSFSIQTVSVDKVKGKSGINAKAAVEAMVDLCPFFSFAEVIEATDTKYAANLRICGSDLAVRAQMSESGAYITFYAGKYSEGGVVDTTYTSTDGIFLNWSTTATQMIISAYILNEAFYMISFTTSTLPHIIFSVGKLKSQFDGRERLVFSPDITNNARGLVLTDLNTIALHSLTGSTLSGQNGAFLNGKPLLVMSPVYLDCTQQFLGLPTIGGGTMYYTSQNLSRYGLYTINGRRYFFFNPTLCVDVS